MITLETGGTLSGKAGTASAITYTIQGDAVTTTDAFKTLAQGQLASSTGTLYTTPASTQALVKQIHLANTTGLDVTGITFYVNGTAAGNQITGTMKIVANGTAVYDSGSWRFYDANGALIGTTVVTAAGVSYAGGPTLVATNVEDALDELSTEKVDSTRSIATTAPLAGGGDMSANRTLTLNTDGVDNTFLANMATDTVKGRSISSGSGDPIDLSRAQLTALVNPATIALQGAMSATDKTRMAQVYDAQADFGFVGDLKTYSDGACSTGANTKITSATASFVSGDLGKRVTLAGAGASAAMYVGIITAIDSGTQVTVSPAVGTTVSGKCLQWGTDNTTAITNLQNTVNNAAFPGVQVIFGQSSTNSYGFPTPVVLNKPIQVLGIGGGHTADTGDYTRIGGTRLAWWASSSDGGTAFRGFWTVSPTGVQSLKHVAFRSCWLDCRNGDQNQALYGLKLASCHGWALDDFFVMDPLAIGVWMDIATSPTEARDTTRGMATNFCMRLLDATSSPSAITTTATTTSSAVNVATSQSLTTAAAIGFSGVAAGYAWVMSSIGKPTLVNFTGGGGTTSLTGVICATEDAANNPTTVSGSNIVFANPALACGFYLNGGTGANTSCNTFVQGQLSHGSAWGPAAVELGNSDSNAFQQLFINGGTRANLGAINRMTKPGIRVNGSATSLALAARNNTFTGGDVGSLPTTNGGMECMGLLNTGALQLAPSGPTYYDLHQFGNGADVPRVEKLATSATQGAAGAICLWSGNGAVRIGGNNVPATAAQTVSATTALLAGSLVAIPPQGIQIGTQFRWKFFASKTATGTTSTFTVRLGAAGTTADAVIQTFTTTETAAIDQSPFEFVATVTAIGASATTYAVRCIPQVAATATTGFASTLAARILVGTPTTFNSVQSGFTYMNLTLASGTGVWTINGLTCEVITPGSS